MKKTGKILWSVLLTFALLCMPLSEAAAAAEPEQGIEKQEKAEDAVDAVGRTEWEDISLSSYTDITLDTWQDVTIAQAGGYQVFRFIPTVTSEYTFFSEGDYDTYGMIGDVDGAWLRSDDDGGDDESNFSLTFNLTAGETYYYVAQIYSSERMGSFRCKIEKKFTLNAENIASFEIIEPAKDTWYEGDTEYTEYETSVPLDGLSYRITCTDGTSVENTVIASPYAPYVYGAYIGGRYKNMTDSGKVDTESGNNAIVYYLYTYNYENDERVILKEAAEVPITFGVTTSPVASIEVTNNPWPQAISQTMAENVIRNRAGLAFTVTYMDGNEEEFLADSVNSTKIDDGYYDYIKYSFKEYDINWPSSPKIGENAIVISYLGTTAEIPVTIQVGVSNLQVTKNPEKMFYASPGEEIDLYGLELSVTYSDGTSGSLKATGHGSSFSDADENIVSSGFSWDDDDEYIEGIWISYRDYDIVIGFELPVNAISIVRNPDKMLYSPIDKNVDLYGMVLRFSYRDGKTKDVTVTEHGSYYRVNDEYGRSISASFIYGDDEESKVGVRVYYMSGSTSYTPQFGNYAPVFAGAADVAVGQSVQVSLNQAVTYRTFRFVSPGTGTFTFRSSGGGDIDTYVHLADAAGNRIATNDDGADVGNHFSISQKLEQGKTYYYIVTMYNLGDTGNFTCTLTADMLVLNKLSLRLAPGAGEKLVATLPAELAGVAVTWTSSNPAVATVAADGTVTAVTYGTAVITASASGQTMTCQITVPYSITYHLNGGANSAENPADYYGENIALKAPTRAKYAFEGWYTDKKCTKKNKITQILAGANKNYELYAKWKKVAKPGKTQLLSAKNAKGSKISVKCKKVKKVDGYEIAYSMSKKFKKSAPTVASNKVKATISGLQKGKTYYVRVRTYNLDSAGNKIGGAWSSAKKVAVKK